MNTHVNSDDAQQNLSAATYAALLAAIDSAAGPRPTTQTSQANDLASVIAIALEARPSASGRVIADGLATIYPALAGQQSKRTVASIVAALKKGKSTKRVIKGEKATSTIEATAENGKATPPTRKIVATVEAQPSFDIPNVSPAVVPPPPCAQLPRTSDIELKDLVSRPLMGGNFKGTVQVRKFFHGCAHGASLDIMREYAKAIESDPGSVEYLKHLHADDQEKYRAVLVSMGAVQ